MSNNEQIDALREHMIAFVIQSLKNLDNNKLRNVYHFVLHIK